MQPSAAGISVRIWFKFFALVLILFGASASVSASQTLLSLTEKLCSRWSDTGAIGSVAGSESVSVEPIPVGSRHHIRFADQTRLELDVIDASGRELQFLATEFNDQDKPHALISLAADCRFRMGRRIRYTEQGHALYVENLDSSMQDMGDRQWLNPLLPSIDTADHVTAVPPRVRVGMIDSGVNYLIPQINRRLARKPDGTLIGYDFWDLDELPFDAHPARSAFFVQRHGTRTASLLLAEAPDIELVPYRYPRPDMSRMRELIEHADAHSVHIIGMPLGGNQIEDWAEFGRVAAEHPHILFIVSAGNNGRNIDQRPVYPAALPLTNMLVVTSADDFIRPAERTNWGVKTVDYLIPAEWLSVTGFDGKPTFASGSSYAVARLTALVANIKHLHRTWDAEKLAAEIDKRYTIMPDTEWVSRGYIPDPLAATANIRRKSVTLTSMPEPSERAEYKLDLSVQVLNQHWHGARIEALLQDAFAILAQCHITAGDIKVQRIAAAPYVQDLSVGTAHTLLGLEPASVATLVLANDTRMLDPYEAEAFGLGNTRTRPWLRNTVWLTQSMTDEGIAAPHELFHILTNDGSHVEQTGNLMLAETQGDNTALTLSQCERAWQFGVTSGLLQKIAN